MNNSNIEEFGYSKFHTVSKVTFVILSIIYFITVRLIFEKVPCVKTDSVSTESVPTESNLGLIGNFNSDIRYLAGNLSLIDSESDADADILNKVKYFMIYIMIILVMILVGRSAYYGFKDPKKNGRRLLSKTRLFESSFAAFMVSIGTLLLSYAKSGPEGPNTVVAASSFAMVFAQTYLVKGYQKFNTTNPFHYMLGLVLGLPLLTNLINCFQNKSIEFTSNLKQNILFMIYGLCLYTIIINVVRTHKTSRTEPMALIYKGSLLTLIYNAVVSKNSSIF